MQTLLPLHTYPAVPHWGPGEAGQQAAPFPPQEAHIAVLLLQMFRVLHVLPAQHSWLVFPQSWQSTLVELQPSELPLHEFPLPVQHDSARLPQCWQRALEALQYMKLGTLQALPAQHTLPIVPQSHIPL